MSKKNRFVVTYKGEGSIYRIFFRSWNQRAVQCTLIIEHPKNHILQGCYKFIGKSLCNVEEGDVFDLREGQKIALHKALKKYDAYILKMVKCLEKESSNLNKQLCNSLGDIITKFNDRWDNE